jgi:pimeloyl-ACP methyl ester carboxylesterase
MPAAAPLASRSLRVKGLQLHYQEGGQGRPVLLIHGLGSSGSLEWRRNLDALAARHHVLALDLPGFGRSDKPRLEYTLDFFVDCVAQFLSAVGVSQVSVVGASLGGRIAFELALQDPAQVERLCLVDALGFGHPKRNLVYTAMVLPGVGEAILRTVGSGLRLLRPHMIRHLWAWYSRRPRHYAALLSDAHLRDARTLFEEPGFQAAYLGTLRGLAGRSRLRDHVLVSAEAHRIAVPALIIWGAQDRLFPLSHAHAAARQIPEARLVIFETCGHTPQLEAAEEFNRLLLDFLG